MSFIWGSIVSYFYPPEPVEEPSERFRWIQQFDLWSVKTIIGETDLEHISIKQKLELFTAVQETYSHKQKIQKIKRRQQRSRKVEIRNRKPPLIITVAAKSVLPLAKSHPSPKMAHEVLPPPPISQQAVPIPVLPPKPSRQGISPYVVQDLFHQAELLGDEFFQSVQGELNQLDQRALLSVPRQESLVRFVKNRIENRQIWERALEERFSPDQLKDLEPVLKRCFFSFYLGRKIVSPEILSDVSMIYDHLRSRQALQPALDKILQLDEKNAPKELHPIVQAKIMKAVNYEILMDRILQKFEEIDRYDLYVCELQREDQDILTSPIRRTEIRESERLVQQNLNGLGRKVASLKNAYFRESGRDIPEVNPLQALVLCKGLHKHSQDRTRSLQEQLFVIPEGNVLFKEQTDKGVESDPSGRWVAVHDGSPVFYEQPKEVFASHEDRDYGQVARILKNKKTGEYARRIGNPNDFHSGEKDERTAFVDMYESIWISRLIVKTALSGGVSRINWRHLQRFIEYFWGINNSDLSVKYNSFSVYVQARDTFFTLEQSFKERIEDGISLQIVQAHQKGKKKDDKPNEGIKRAAEIVRFYRDWSSAIDLFLEQVRYHKAVGRHLEKFIKEIEELKPPIEAFRGSFPQEVSDIESLERLLDAFSKLENRFSGLTLALNELQKAQNSNLIQNTRASQFKINLERAAKEFWNDLTAHLMHERNRMGDKEISDQDLIQLSKFVKVQYKKKFPEAPVSAGILSFLFPEQGPAEGQDLVYKACIEKFGAEKGPQMATLARNALNSLSRLQKAYEVIAGNVFQTAKRADDCLQGALDSFPTLTSVHFRIATTLAAVRKTVIGIEGLRTRESQISKGQMGKEAALKYFF